MALLQVIVADSSRIYPRIQNKLSGQKYSDHWMLTAFYSFSIHLEARYFLFSIFSIFYSFILHGKWNRALVASRSFLFRLLFWLPNYKAIFQPGNNISRLNTSHWGACSTNSVLWQYHLLCGWLLFCSSTKTPNPKPNPNTQGSISVVHVPVQFLLLFKTCNSSSSGVLQADGTLRARNELSITQDLSASRFLTLSFSLQQAQSQITLSCCEFFKVTQQLWQVRAVIVFGWKNHLQLTQIYELIGVNWQLAGFHLQAELERMRALWVSFGQR